MKKLVLHKETLRTLQDSELRRVVGGIAGQEEENHQMQLYRTTGEIPAITLHCESMSCPWEQVEGVALRL